MPTTRSAELPATIEAGVATSKAFMVYDFRLPDESLAAAMGVMGEHGGMLQVHCEDPDLLDAGIAAALARGDTAPRFHAGSRPPNVEAVATARAMGFAGPHRCAGPCRPPLVGGRARRGPRAPRRPASGSRPRPARTTSS